MNDPQATVGFIGLGTMGEPMARNLLRAGTPLVAWNRTPGKARALASEGAAVADSVAEVFERAGTVLLMLFDGEAVDAVLGRGTPGFAALVRDRLVVPMGTAAPGWSRGLHDDIRAAGGRYVEAPVSGSRKPAEAGQLVAMLAGEAADVEAVRPLLAPLCREAIPCGPVPNALSMKLASNLFVGTVLTGLAEAMHYAARQGLDLHQFASVLSAGPASSDLLRMKTPKLVARDFSVQAAVANVLDTYRMIAETARDAGIAVPVSDTCHALFREAAGLGLEDADVVAVLRAIEARSGPGEG